MVKIICRAIDCIYWEDNLCSAEEITYDPEEGCMTYEVIDDILDEEDWEDEGEELEDLIDDDEGFYDYDDEELEEDIFDDTEDDW